VGTVYDLIYMINMILMIEKLDVTPNFPTTVELCGNMY
jgi:hypothetical protein